MRKKIKEELITTEQVVIGDYVIEYTYSIIESNIVGAIIAAVKMGEVNKGHISTYTPETLNNQLTIKYSDDHSAIIEQVKVDFKEIREGAS